MNHDFSDSLCSVSDIAFESNLFKISEISVFNDNVACSDTNLLKMLLILAFLVRIALFPLAISSIVDRANLRNWMLAFLSSKRFDNSSIFQSLSVVSRLS